MIKKKALYASICLVVVGVLSWLFLFATQTPTIVVREIVANNSCPTASNPNPPNPDSPIRVARVACAGEGATVVRADFGWRKNLEFSNYESVTVGAYTVRLRGIEPRTHIHQGVASQGYIISFSVKKEDRDPEDIKVLFSPQD